ncbi:hypothetical protein [Flavobacterium hibisci]|uniref:hypothetical protein n=1 Tax=Flavobacterium hibisci TaxID=1914462 RepID=UPI001CBD6F05|nr:hypothetical protein [Flavobacterium hibisci]MBZ4042120.1 hypothetical protein [Flavobacterium hibisci]
MKKSYLTTILLVAFVAIISSNCSPHCDDEDYTRDQKEAVLHQKDSVKILVD